MFDFVALPKLAYISFKKFNALSNILVIFSIHEKWTILQLGKMHTGACVTRYLNASFDYYDTHQIALFAIIKPGNELTVFIINDTTCCFVVNSVTDANHILLAKGHISLTLL